MATTTERKATADELAAWRDECEVLVEMGADSGFARRLAALRVAPMTFVVSVMLWAVGKRMPFALLAAMQIAILGAGVAWFLRLLRQSRQHWRAQVEALRADIEDGRVRETRHEIREALVVAHPGQPEARHLFVLSSDDMIVHFPPDPGAPELSEPRRTLVEVTRWVSDDLINQLFEGERIDPGPVREFQPGHGQWVSGDEPYTGTWAALQAMLAPTR